MPNITPIWIAFLGCFIIFFASLVDANTTKTVTVTNVLSPSVVTVQVTVWLPKSAEEETQRTTVFESANLTSWLPTETFWLTSTVKTAEQQSTYGAISSTIAVQLTTTNCEKCSAGITATQTTSSQEIFAVSCLSTTATSYYLESGATMTEVVEQQTTATRIYTELPTCTQEDKGFVPEQESEIEVVRASVQEQIEEPVQQLNEAIEEPIQKQIENPIQSSVQEPIEESVQQLIEAPVQEQVQESVLKFAFKLIEESVIQPIQQQIVQEPNQQTVQESVQEPGLEFALNLIQESVIQPIQQLAQEPVEESALNSVLEQIQKSVSEVAQQSFQQDVEEANQQPIEEHDQEIADNPVAQSIEEPLESVIQEPIEEPLEQVQEQLENVQQPIEEQIEEQVQQQIEEPVQEQIEEHVQSSTEHLAQSSSQESLESTVQIQNASNPTLSQKQASSSDESSSQSLPSQSPSSPIHTTPVFPQTHSMDNVSQQTPADQPILPPQSVLGPSGRDASNSDPLNSESNESIISTIVANPLDIAIQNVLLRAPSDGRLDRVIGYIEQWVEEAKNEHEEEDSSVNTPHFKRN